MFHYHIKLTMISYKSSITMFKMFCWVVYYYAQNTMALPMVSEMKITEAKFEVMDKYFGVTVVVRLNDVSNPRYCMGFMVNQNSSVSEGNFEHVITAASCLKQGDDGISEISVCIQGNPYIKTCNSTIGVIDDKHFFHPLYNASNNLGDIVVIKMNKPFFGTTYTISNETPDDLFRRTNLRDMKVIMWSDSLIYKPLYSEYRVVESKLLAQYQTLTYTDDELKCPLNVNSSTGFPNVEKRFWYMFICADFTEPTRNKVHNPGALVIYKGKVIGIHSYSFPKSIVPGIFDSFQSKLKEAQIHRYTMLYWYAPWIHNTIALDIGRKDEVDYDEIKPIFSSSTKTPAPGFIVTPSDYFQADYLYEDIIRLNNNPCDDAKRLAGCIKLEITLIGLVLTSL